MMKEFGSDFHLIESFTSDQGHLTDMYRDAVLMADGRQCIEVLIRQFRWKRLWMPEYFCYNIIEYLQKNTGVDIAFYTDYPGNDDVKAVSNLAFCEGDVLLRMNYFGLRSFRSTKDIPVPVIEDHSHDLVGDWAKNSDADWCIASLRKIIPIPEGGILWSPKGYAINFHPELTSFNDDLARRRWLAMEDKYKYLTGDITDKESFRRLYLETEEAFDELGISTLDKRSMAFLACFDLSSWNHAKKRNWKVLSGLSSNEGIEVLSPENDNLTPFSLILLCKDQAMRDRVRRTLIASSVFPAVLWNVPNSAYQAVKDFSNKMLSIHCDGRYNDDEIEKLFDIINTKLQND
jgi:hypothetical protein